MEAFGPAETARGHLEELERIEQALAERVLHRPDWVDGKRTRENVAQQHEAAALVARYRAVARQVDLAALADAPPASVPSPAEFLEMVASIPENGPAIDLRALYARHAGAAGLGRFRCDATADLDIDKVFSLAESYGKLLDLAAPHQTFLSIPGAPRVTFREYVDKLGDFDDLVYLPVKKKREFAEYLALLGRYLQEFYAKTHPFDPDPPFEAPTARWCDVCQKQFASDGVFEAHFSGRKHKRALEGGAVPADAVRVAQLCKLLEPELAATRANIARLAALTPQERQIENEVLLHELEEQDEYVSADEADSTGPDSGPGPGQAVPAWLAKINGLHRQYPCEICGNAVYHGPKAFEKHFGEARHLHGLRCLGVVDAAPFGGLTAIAEATALQRSLARQRRDDAEVEDEDGNVLTVRVYEDLKRQGLL